MKKKCFEVDELTFVKKVSFEVDEFVFEKKGVLMSMSLLLKKSEF